MLRFQAENVFQISGRGTVYVVYLNRQCDDFNWLLGHDVTVVFEDNEIVFEVTGVERRAHAPPWRKGESIGLLQKVESVLKENPWKP